MAMINRHNGDDMEIASRPWWLAAAIKTDRGIVVARCWGLSTTLHYSGEIGRYDTSPDYTGRRVSYMIDLTEDDMREYGLTPGVLGPDAHTVINGLRPRHNHSTTPVSEHAANAHRDWVLNDCVGPEPTIR